MQPASARDAPLFDSSRCAIFSGTADRLLSMQINRLSAKLASAVQGRLDRVPNRRCRDQKPQFELHHLQKWFSAQDIHLHQQRPVARGSGSISWTIPNFDCLSSNNAAGRSKNQQPGCRPAEQVERSRWTAALADKDNVPLDELRNAVTLARRPPKLPRPKAMPSGCCSARCSPLPDADAINLCVAQMHAANGCEGFLGRRGWQNLFQEVALDAGYFDPPLIRYRLQVVEKAIPQEARDFTSSHQVVGVLGGTLRWKWPGSIRSTLRTSYLAQLTFHLQVLPPPSRGPCYQMHLSRRNNIHCDNQRVTITPLTS